MNYYSIRRFFCFHKYWEMNQPDFVFCSSCFKGIRLKTFGETRDWANKKNVIDNRESITDFLKVFNV